MHRPGLLNAATGGAFAVHRAVGNLKRSFEFCKILIDASPSSVTHRQETGDLPFHHACSGGHLSTVKYLYELYPESIGITGSEGEYPCVL